MLLQLSAYLGLVKIMKWITERTGRRLLCRFKGFVSGPPVSQLKVRIRLNCMEDDSENSLPQRNGPRLSPEIYEANENRALIAWIDVSCVQCENILLLQFVSRIYGSRNAEGVQLTVEG